MSEGNSIRKICPHDQCDRAARAKGFCVKHYYAARRTGILPMPPCSIEGCGRPAYHHGWCNMHYRRWANHGDPLTRKKSGNGDCKNAVCSVPGCGEKGRGSVRDSVYCRVHFDRMRRHGDPHIVLRVRNGGADEVRKKAQAAERQRRYSATPHGKMRSHFNAAKRRALKFGCDWTTGITKEVFAELASRTECAICGFYMPPGDRTIDHIIPLSASGPNHPANLQTVHLTCNIKKGGRRPKHYKRKSPTSKSI